ncbi:MAG: glycerol-3-phosphate acyltransferase [Candidatus Kapaibacterium sp.]
MDIDILPFVSALAAYLLGCFPSAYLLVRSSTGKNILDEGTGNMGGMNSYEVTGRRWVGIAVALLDAAKGVVACVVPHAVGASSTVVAYAAVAVVLGHCYNVFFRFRGGRGIATAGGVALALNPLPLLLWALMYLTGFTVIRKDIHVGSMTGIIGLLILTYTTPTTLLNLTMMMPPFEPGLLKGVVYMLCFIMFLRHIEPVRALFEKMRADEAEE